MLGQSHEGSKSGNPEATFKDDLNVARAAIASEATQGRDVVLIAHSYGGMVANSAIKGFTGPYDEIINGSHPAKGHIVGLVLIASGLTLTELSLDPLFGTSPPTWRVNKETGFAGIVTNSHQLCYHDLSADEADE